MRGAYLGLTIAAWVLLALASLVLANRPEAPDFWRQLIWLSVGWILLGWFGRSLKRWPTLILTSLVCAVTAVFGGLHAAGVLLGVILIIRFSDRSEQPAQAPKSQPATLIPSGAEKRVYAQSCAITGVCALVAIGIWWANTPHEFVPPEALADWRAGKFEHRAQ